MKNNKYLLNTILTAVVFAAMAAKMILRVIQPAAVLPPLNIPNMAALILIALLIEHYLAPGNDRCYFCISIFGALTFGLLPMLAGFACQHTFWKIGLVGGVVTTVIVWLFTSMTDRLVSGPKAKAAAAMSAFGLYLAAQCFAGMIL